jgi:hypothetical protein
MASFVPTRPETLEDQRRYTSDGMVEVACLDCLARVAVRKNGEHHTSIQWTAEAVAACPQLCRSTPTSGRDRHRGCPRMAASIDAAAAEGAVPIGSADGY